MKVLTEEKALELTVELLQNDKNIKDELEAKIPSMDGLASEEYVSAEIAKAALAGGDVDLSAYYTKTETNNLLDGKADKTDIPDVSNLATEEYVEQYVNEALEDIDVDVNLDNYYSKDETYSKSEVDTAIENAQIAGGNVDLTDYVKTETMNTALAGKADVTHTHDQYLTEHQSLDNYALKTEIPSLDGYVKTDDLPDTSNFVEKEDGKGLFSGSYNDLTDKPTIPEAYDDSALVEMVEDVETALDNKADKTELHTHTNKDVLDDITSDKVASWDAKATEEFVTSKINEASLSGGSVDMSIYYTKTETDDLLADKADSSAIPDVSNFVEKEAGKGLFSGSYNDLTDKPAIPSVDSLVSEDYLTTTLSDYALKSELPTNYLTEIPDEYVTETEMNEAIANIQSMSVSYDTTNKSIIFG